MIPMNIWDIQLPLRSLYSKCIEPVCRRYELTRTEFDILLFLANNPKYDTAAEICEVRYLTKSHVSISLRSLRRNGYIAYSVSEGDKRRIHLKVTEKAVPVVREGRERQADFAEIILYGLNEQERAQFHACIQKIEENIKNYLEASET